MRPQPRLAIDILLLWKSRWTGSLGLAWSVFDESVGSLLVLAIKKRCPKDKKVPMKSHL